MAFYHAKTELSSNVLTTVLTATGEQELVAVRVVAWGNTAEQMFEIHIGDASDHIIGYMAIPLRTVSSSVSPFSAQFVAPYALLSNGHTIKVKSANTDAFSVYVVTQDV